MFQNINLNVELFFLDLKNTMVKEKVRLVAPNKGTIYSLGTHY